MSIPLDSFSVVCANEKEWYSPEADGFHFTSVRLDREHILSACSYMAALPDHIQHVSLSTLYETLLQRDAKQPDCLGNRLFPLHLLRSHRQPRHPSV